MNGQLQYTYRTEGRIQKESNDINVVATQLTGISVIREAMKQYPGHSRDIRSDESQLLYHSPASHTVYHYYHSLLKIKTCVHYYHHDDDEEALDKEN